MTDLIMAARSAVLVLALAVPAVSFAAEEAPKPDAAPAGPVKPDDPGRVANITAAAANIGTLQAEKGGAGAIEAINACYKREIDGAKEITPGLEGCMTQDIAVSRMAAAVYQKVGAEQRDEKGTPDPKDVLHKMALRIAGLYSHFDAPEEAAKDFVHLVDDYGMNAYQQALIAKLPKPEGEAGGNETDKGVSDDK